MTSVDLVRIAAEAEAVRLRGRARRAVGQIIVLLLALTFLFMAVGFVHAGVWFWLRESLGWTGPATAATIAVGDLAVAGLLAGLASRSSPSQVERDARLIRDRAWLGIRESVMLTTLIRPAFRLLIGLLRRWRD